MGPEVCVLWDKVGKGDLHSSKEVTGQNVKKGTHTKETIGVLGTAVVRPVGVLQVPHHLLLSAWHMAHHDAARQVAQRIVHELQFHLKLKHHRIITTRLVTAAISNTIIISISKVTS